MRADGPRSGALFFGAFRSFPDCPGVLAHPASHDLSAAGRVRPRGRHFDGMMGRST